MLSITWAESWVGPAAGRWRHRAVALAAGAAAAAAQAPLGLWPAMVAALPVAVALWLRAPGARAAFGIGWWVGLGYFAAALFWIVEPFLVDPVRHGWMAPFALPLMAGGLALFWAAGFALAQALAPMPALAPVLAGGRGRLPRALVLAGCWTLAEYARGHLLTGFPWAMPGYGLIDTPFLRLAAFIGPHGLNLALFVVAALLAGLAGWGGRLTVLAGCGLAALGLAALARPEVADTGIVVRVVQPNARQDQKWQPGMVQLFYDRLIAETAAPAGRAPDLVIWPETAVPFLLGDRPDLEAEMSAAAGGAPLVAGIRRLDDDRRWFNALAALSPGGEVVVLHDKHHLTPFGEYMPLRDLSRRLGLEALAAAMPEGFTPGAPPTVRTLAGLPPFLPLICYEMIFPAEVRRAAPGARWIMHVTNDAWFGGIAGPQQHLAQARARAAELGLPVIRAANTGISAVIGPDGTVLAALGLGVAGHLDQALPAAYPPTAYARAGDLPAVMAMLLAAAAGAMLARRG